MAAGKQQEVVPPPPPVAASTYDESQTAAQSKSSRSNRKKWVLIASLFVIFITVDTVVFLTLDRIFFGVRTAEYRLQSVTVPNLRVSNSSSNGLEPTSPPPSLNMQLKGEVTLMNRNLFGTYRFHDEYLTFSYEGKSVGEAVITGTRVNARSTKTIAFLALNVTANTGSRNSIKITAFSELKGQARVLNLFPKNKSAKLNCDLSVNFVEEIVEDLICH